MAASPKGRLGGDGQALAELGDVTPVEHWLAGLLLQEIELLERYDDVGKFVGARPPGRSGSRTI